MGGPAQIGQKETRAVEQRMHPGNVAWRQAGVTIMVAQWLMLPAPIGRHSSSRCGSGLAPG
jgi:hypothetical protein